MNAKLIMTVKQMEDREAWLKMRKKGIGGSDAGAILGVSPWASRFSLWADKTSDDIVEKERTDEENEVMYWGTVQEENVAREFTKRTGKKVRRMGMIQNNEYPWLLADLDRIVEGEDAGLECKTAREYMRRKWDDDKIPDTYYCQVLHYMLVGGFKKFYIAVLIGGATYKWKCIDGSDPKVKKDIDALFEAEKDFWENYVVPKKMPPVDDSKACTKELSKRFEKEAEDEIILGSDANQLCADIASLKAHKKDVEAQIELKSNQLKEMIGGHQYGICTDFIANFGFRKKTSINTKKIKAEVPYIANNEEFWKTTHYRDLRIKTIDGEEQ